MTDLNKKIVKPKVLFIIHLPPPIHGASIISTFIRDSKLIEKEFDADFINLGIAKSLDDVGKNSIGKITDFLKIVWQVISALSKKKYDLCFVTLTAKTPVFYKDLVIVWILKIFGKNKIYLFNNKGASDSNKGFFTKWLYDSAFANSRSIVNAKVLYEDIRPFTEEKNVFVLPNGIPEVVPAEELDFESKFNSKFKMLFLSNMMAEKGVYILIEACRLLKERNLEFECHFVGDWSDVTEDDFRSFVGTNSLSSYVFAHGKKYGEEKTRFFMEADLFVFPTFYHRECFPLVLLEAMQFGLPTISTREGGISDIVAHGETGFIVKRRDTKDLADNIETLIRQRQLCNDMGKDARQRYENLFTLQKFEENLSNILHKSVGS